MNVLSIDVGGTHVKVFVTGRLSRANSDLDPNSLRKRWSTASSVWRRLEL